MSPVASCSGPPGTGKTLMARPSQENPQPLRLREPAGFQTPCSSGWVSSRCGGCSANCAAWPCGYGGWSSSSTRQTLWQPRPSSPAANGAFDKSSSSIFSHRSCNGASYLSEDTLSLLFHGVCTIRAGHCWSAPTCGSPSWRGGRHGRGHGGMGTLQALFVGNVRLKKREDSSTGWSPVRSGCVPATAQLPHPLMMAPPTFHRRLNEALLRPRPYRIASTRSLSLKAGRSDL